MLKDPPFVILCVLRVLQSSKSGRDFLQSHGIPGLNLANYFGSLGSKCRLALITGWKDTRRLAPLLDEQHDKLAAGSMEPKHLRWTLTNIIEFLKTLRRETISLCGTTFDQITEPTADQARLLKLLQTPPEPTANHSGPAV